MKRKKAKCKSDTNRKQLGSTLRNSHADADFTFAIKRQMRNILSLFGSDNFSVLPVDDKAKVSIDITAET